MFLIKLNVLVIGNDNDTSAYPSGSSPATIVKLVDDLNDFFAHAEMRFLFDPASDLREVFSSQLNNDCPDMKDCRKSKDLTNALARTKLAMVFNDRLTFIFRDGPNLTAGNFSSPTSYAIVLAKESMKLHKKVAHELGHFFHLIHTFSKEPDMQTVIDDIRKYVKVGGHPINEGLDALKIYDGDTENVGDTPYDLGASIFGGNVCNPNATLKLTVDFQDPALGIETYEYVPQMRTNIMSYFDGCPWDHNFSTDQIEVMHKTLISGNRQRLLKGREWDRASVQDMLSPAAVSRNSQAVAVFATDENGVMKSRVWDASRDSYWPGNGWFNLGGSGLTAPVVSSRKPDTIDLFSRPIDGLLVNKAWNESTGEYWPGNSAWNLLFANDWWIASKPAVVSREPHLVDIFTRWTDGTVRSRSWDQKWHNYWENLGGEGAGTPAAVSRRADLVDLFIRWSDGSIRSKVWRQDRGSWYPHQTAWINLFGRGYDSPTAISRVPDKIDLFIRWNDGTIRSKVWQDAQNAWWPGENAWFNLGGDVSSEPVVVSRNKYSILLLARWSDGTVRIKVWDDGRGSWWPNNVGWFNLGGNTIGRPTAVVRDEDHVIVYARWTDDSIRTKVWNDATSKWWPGEKEWHSLGKP